MSGAGTHGLIIPGTGLHTVLTGHSAGALIPGSTSPGDGVPPGAGALHGYGVPLGVLPGTGAGDGAGTTAGTPVTAGIPVTVPDGIPDMDPASTPDVPAVATGPTRQAELVHAVPMAALRLVVPRQAIRGIMTVPAISYVGPAMLQTI